MAVAKVRSGSPVHSYNITTIFTGRISQTSGNGFGVPRFGGVENAYVDGLVGGGTAANRVYGAAAQAFDPSFSKHRQAELAEEAKHLAKEHDEFVKTRKETAKAEAEAAKKFEEFEKKQVEEAKKYEDQKAKAPNTVEVLKDPKTGEQHVVGKDNAVATDLDDPKKIAEARKTAEEASKKNNPPPPPAEPKK